MTRSHILPTVLVVVGVLALAACAPGGNTVAVAGGADQAGFWLGLWHGAIAPITFIVSLFNGHVNVYEVHNSGNWYNFGFMIGLSASLGGAARSGRGAGPKRVAK
jgi:hypothetical protein